jgi:hypothetical protein
VALLRCTPGEGSPFYKAMKYCVKLPEDLAASLAEQTLPDGTVEVTVVGTVEDGMLYPISVNGIAVPKEESEDGEDSRPMYARAFSAGAKG